MSDIDKPSKAEDEYFARQELERKKKWEQERLSKMESTEREQLKQLHFMKCPKCGMDLHHIDFQGIELDRCVSCNGTWFDEGEMEQLLEEKNRGIIGKLGSLFR